VLFEADRAYARISIDLQYELAERVPLVFVAGDVAPGPAAAAGLTHAFESELAPTLSRVPLWFLEGLAEFERRRWMPSEPARVAVIVPFAQLTADNHMRAY
jgi:hypothetical protein